MTTGIITQGGNSHMTVSNFRSRAEAGPLSSLASGLSCLFPWLAPQLFLRPRRNPVVCRLRSLRSGKSSALAAACYRRELWKHLWSGMMEGPAFLLGFGVGRTDGITMPRLPSNPERPSRYNRPCWHVGLAMFPQVEPSAWHEN